jgi:hypothetical protein
MESDLIWRKIMKAIFVIALALGMVGPLLSKGIAADVLPFDVSIGGQKAVLSSSKAIFASIPNPVPNNADVRVHQDTQTVIINVFSCDEKGNPTDGAAPAILMLQGKASGTMAETLDKKPLGPGTYVANVVSNGKTSRVFFQIK